MNFFDERKRQINKLYNEWLGYYNGWEKDPDGWCEHIEPNRKPYDKLSDFEFETIRRMAMVHLKDYFV